MLQSFFFKKKSIITVAGLHCQYNAAQLHINTFKDNFNLRSKYNQHQIKSHPPSTRISLLVCLSVFLFNSSVQHVLEKPSWREREWEKKVCVGVGVNLWQRNRRRMKFCYKFAVWHLAFYWKRCPGFIVQQDSTLTWALRTSRGNIFDAHDWQWLQLMWIGSWE